MTRTDFLSSRPGAYASPSLDVVTLEAKDMVCQATSKRDASTPSLSEYEFEM